MRRTKNKTLPRLAPLTLAALACFGILVASVAARRVGAQSPQKQKVGADLKEKVKGAGYYDELNVVVVPASSWTSGLDSDLRGKGAKQKPAYKSFPFRAVRVRARDVDAIAARADVAYVALDRAVKRLGHVTTTSGADAARALGGPTALDGTGVGIAVLDSGIDPNHVAFTDSNKNSRVVFSKDFTGEGRTDDPYGHGTHVASLAAGNDAVSSGAYTGVAPNARLVNLRVLDSQGNGTASSVLAALDWVLVNRALHNIRVVNLSLGTPAVDSYRVDPLCVAARRLADAGVVVVAAAGNEGKDGAGNKIYGQIHSPGNDPSVITVGATNTFGTDYRSDDVVTTYSSRGPSRSFRTDALGVRHYDNLLKPDLVAPGNRLVDAQAYQNLLVTQTPSLDANVSGSAARKQMYLSGTSMAAPVVAGAAALMLQANDKLTPNLVKALLMYTAQSLAGFNHFEQGAGEANVEGAVRLAKLVRRDLSAATPVGAPLLTAAAPAPQTTVNGHTFAWGQGVVLDHTYATGSDLITKYQKVYGLGALLADATVESSGALMADGTLMSDGVLLGDNILRSDGALMADGTIFCGTGVLLSDGVMLMDGTLMSDGTLMGDGVIMGDGALFADLFAQSGRALVYGDVTASMQPVADPAPKSPTSLAVKAASSGQLSLTWADASSNEDGFRVERCQGATCTSFAQVAQLGRNVKTYTDAGLTRGAVYRYRVRAYHGGANSAYTAVASASPK